MNELSHLDIEDHLWDYSPTCIGLGVKTIRGMIGRSLLFVFGLPHIKQNLYISQIHNLLYKWIQGRNSYYKGVKC